jgi:hypothetical protein
MHRDYDQLNRNLEALHQEVRELRQELEGVTALEHEATISEILDLLAPAISEMVRIEAGNPEASPTKVIEGLTATLEALGLRRLGRPGAVVEHWPDEAVEELELDQPPPPEAGMVRIEVLAAGWGWGYKVVARPVGQVLEVFEIPTFPGDADE